MERGESIYEKLYKKDPKEFTREDANLLVRKPETPGEERGEHILSLLKYLKEKKKEDGLKKFLKEMEILGHPVRPERINPLGWYPVGARGLTFVVLRRVFDWRDKDFVEMGKMFPSFSFIVRFFFRYFRSKKMAFEHIPEYWRKHYTCGRLKGVEFHEEEESNFFIMRLYDFKIYPSFCPFFRGYFLQVSKLLGGRDAVIKETECMFKSAPYHEFRVDWK